MNLLNYIANQITPEGLDEVQRVMIAHKLKQNVSLCGPAGVGKTELIETLAKQIVNQKLFDISCNDRMTESPLIGYPTLETNGSTKTGYTNGVVTNAMEQGGIGYLDEFDLLVPGEQKRLNPIFDKRRKITRRDGKEITADDLFRGVISYNPGRSVHGDLEDSVADRFVNMFFGYLPEDVETKVALAKEGIKININTEIRGIKGGRENPQFLKAEVVESRSSGEKSYSWFDFFSGEAVHDTTDIVAYEAFISEPVDTSGLDLVVGTEADIVALTKQLAKYNTIVRSLGADGTTNLEESARTALDSLGECKKVRLHSPSPRTLHYAIAQANLLSNMGMPLELAKRHATRVEMDQICYGNFKNKEIQSGITTYTAVEMIAQTQGLLDRDGVTTTF
ncbi:AAA domain-containing protein [Candidatus Woesearchaeota archaeon]|jgi:hypothetical protein|nr:AAA domain-containing protein [Candidatus Woesearchaeota archaeon]MBT6518805.1 AAA domain-containing protein [Candidatus Woesearchaeota archaeon]MBT7367944.1 AAA domain-containing protein [Candidatus Woesearchaeota archaeon]